MQDQSIPAATGTRIGYARVSTADQNLAGQVARLEAAGCIKVFTDKISGKVASRPGWDECLDFLRDGDVLVATKLDRFGRSIRDLIDIGAMLRDRGIGLVCLNQPVDTTTAMGRMFYAILAVFAEFEREIISERTRDGLAATTARGRSGGRKPSLKPYQVQHARDMIDSKKMTVAALAREMGVSRQTLYRSLERKAS